KSLRGDNSAIVAVGENRKRKIFFRDKEEIRLLTMSSAAVSIRCQIIRITDEPCGAHITATSRVNLHLAHGFQRFLFDDSPLRLGLAIAHVEACVLEQIPDGTNDSSYTVACSANCPRTRHLDLSVFKVMSHDKPMRE